MEIVAMEILTFRPKRDRIAKKHSEIVAPVVKTSSTIKICFTLKSDLQDLFSEKAPFTFALFFSTESLVWVPVLRFLTKR